MRQGRSSGRPLHFEENMQVKFIGNPRDASDNRGFIVWAGERFELNVARDLPEGKAFAKIPANGHFEVVDDDWDFDPKAAIEHEADETPVIDEKAELVAFAEEHGVKIDKRWSVAKITAAIEAAATKQESE
jgi:hypothetical protein